MAAWQAAYHGTDKPRVDLAYWHRIYLWPTLRTLNTELHLNQCERGYGAGHTGATTGPFDPIPGLHERPRYQPPPPTL